MTLRDLQVIKEKLMRSNPRAAAVFSRLRRTTSSHEHLRTLIEAGKNVPGCSNDVRRWQRELNRNRRPKR